MDNSSNILEQVIARILYMESQKSGLTQKGMGEIAFQGETSPDRKVRSLFNAKKPRKLTIAEMHAWARGIGKDPVRILGQAMDIVETGGEIPPQPTSNQPGRKPTPPSTKKPKPS